jgi:hypothetical protein
MLGLEHARVSELFPQSASYNLYSLKLLNNPSVHTCATDHCSPSTMNITILSNGLPTPDHEPDCFDLPYTAIGDFNAKPEISLAAVPEISSTPVPEVSKLDFNSFGSHDELVSAVVESMQRSGGCVIQNMICNDILAGLESEIRPHLDQVKQADCTFNLST